MLRAAGTTRSVSEESEAQVRISGVVLKWFGGRITSLGAEIGA